MKTTWTVLCLITCASACLAQGAASKRVTAQVQWSVKGQGPQQAISPPVLRLPGGEELLVPADGRESFEYGADVTLTFSADPNMLPGGMMSRATNGAPMIVGFLAGNLMPYGSTLLALTGTMSATHSLTQQQPCSPLKKNEGGMGSTGANATLSGAQKFDAGNTTIQITLQGDVPVHFTAMASGLTVAGDVRYACGQTAKLAIEPVIEWGLPFNARDQGWVVATTKTPDGSVTTASWRGEERGYTVEKFGKITWSVK
jgi:hypothetical protein